MKSLRIMVISPEPEIGDMLGNELTDFKHEIIRCKPGSEELIDLAAGVHIAVIDRIDEQLELTQFEISLLKKNNPELLIIAISQYPSDQDVEVIKQGIFFYLAGYSEKRLIRLVKAAAKTAFKELEKRSPSKI